MFEMWDWRDIGHGHYSINSLGYVFSNSSVRINSSTKSFEFKTGDELFFEYNPAKGKLKIMSKNENIQYEIDIERNKGA